MLSTCFPLSDRRSAVTHKAICFQYEKTKRYEQRNPSTKKSTLQDLSFAWTNGRPVLLTNWLGLSAHHMFPNMTIKFQDKDIFSAHVLYNYFHNFTVINRRQCTAMLRVFPGKQNKWIHLQCKSFFHGSSYICENRVNQYFSVTTRSLMTTRRECDHHWYNINNNCILTRFHNNMDSYEKARLSCLKINGHIIFIHFNPATLPKRFKKGVQIRGNTHIKKWYLKLFCYREGSDKTRRCDISKWYYFLTTNVSLYLVQMRILQLHISDIPIWIGFKWKNEDTCVRMWFTPTRIRNIPSLAYKYLPITTAPSYASAMPSCYAANQTHGVICGANLRLQRTNLCSGSDQLACTLTLVPEF